MRQSSWTNVAQYQVGVFMSVMFWMSVCARVTQERVASGFPVNSKTNRAKQELTGGDDALPRQGSKHPWKVLMHYEKDSKMLLEDPVDDSLLRFEQTAVERGCGLSKAVHQQISLST